MRSLLSREKQGFLKCDSFVTFLRMRFFGGHFGFSYWTGGVIPRQPTFRVRGGCRQNVWYRLRRRRGECGCFRRRSLRRNRGRCRCFRSYGCERGQYGCFRRGRHRRKRGRRCEAPDWQVLSGKTELHQRENHDLIDYLLLEKESVHIARNLGTNFGGGCHIRHRIPLWALGREVAHWFMLGLSAEGRYSLKTRGK